MEVLVKLRVDGGVAGCGFLRGVMVSEDGGRVSSLVEVMEASFVEGSEMWCLRSS